MNWCWHIYVEDQELCFSTEWSKTLWAKDNDSGERKDEGHDHVLLRDSGRGPTVTNSDHLCGHFEAATCETTGSKRSIGMCAHVAAQEWVETVDIWMISVDHPGSPFQRSPVSRCRESWSKVCGGAGGRLCAFCGADSSGCGGMSRWTAMWRIWEDLYVFNGNTVSQHTLAISFLYKKYKNSFCWIVLDLSTQPWTCPHCDHNYH